ncbi:MAG: cadherin domain-containing protein, partial [Cyclobacteriaceae bacterium]
IVSSDGGGTDVTNTGRVSIATEFIGPLDISGLRYGTLTIDVVLADTEGNIGTPSIETASFSAPSPTAPVLSGLVLTNVFATSITLDINQDITSDLYHVITTSSTPPSINQILSGLDENGNAAVNSLSYSGLIGTNNLTIGSGTEGPTDLALVPETTYVIYFVADNSGSYSSIVSEGFTTAAEPSNDVPVISGQTSITLLEDASREITLSDISVTDTDNIYPTGFTLTVQTGTDYTIVGNTITPTADFNGTLTVPVIVNDGTDDSAPFNLSVTVDPVNDAPVIADLSGISIDENSAFEFSVVSMTAIDVENDVLTWSIISGNTDVNSNTQLPFLIDPATGEIRVEDSADLDFESGTNSFTLEIRVADGITADTTLLSISINDLDDEAPVFTSATNETIDENITASSVVYTAAATDAGSITYSLSGTDETAFSLNANTGELSINASPDFETQASYEVVITATDATSNTADITLTITVTDLDENAPVFTSATSETIDENIASSTVIYTAAATDAGTITYSLSGTDASAFTLNASTGDLSINASPDFETQASYEVVITATDAASNTADITLTITVTDLDENAPVFTSATSETIDENIASSTVIYTAAATDAGTITYTLSGTDETAFTLNASTGDLSINASPDFETQASYEVVITATDDASNTADLTLTITVTDLDENAPVFISATSETIDENITASTRIYTAVATDAGTITYSLSGTDASAFTLNASTGELSINASPDFETQSSYEVVITATDDASNSADLTLSITVNDLDDTNPVIDGLSAISIAENTTAIQNFAANEVVTWSLGGTDASFFTIVVSTGEISFLVAPDFEMPQDANADNVYEVTVTATDGANNSSDLALAVTVTDVNEDITAPVVTVDLLATNNASPELTGTVDDNDATIEVTVNSATYVTTKNQDGRWTLAAGSITPALTDGVYEVVATATDLAGNEGTDNTTNELTVDLTAPVVTVNPSSTLSDSPELTGTVDDNDATIAVTVNSETYAATNNQDGSWTLASGLINSLAVGEYEVSVTATDAVGNVGTDGTSNELTIQPGAPTAIAATNVDFFSFTANWRARTGVTSYQYDVASDADFINLLASYDNISTSALTANITEGIDFNTTYYYRVRAVYASGDVSPSSNVIEVTTPLDAGTTADMSALLTIYNETDGASWTRQNNWSLGTPLRDWDDVTMPEGSTRVTAVNLSNNNLTGSFPSIPSGALTSMTTLNLSGNDLTSLPTLTNLSGLTSLDVSDNKLTFESLEGNTGITGIVYSPQQTALRRISSLEQQGASYEMDRAVPGTSNSYAWKKRNLTTNAVTDITNSGSSYTLSITDFSDEGGYYAEVTSSAVPDLTITTAEIVIKVSSLERDFAALQNIFDGMNGADWTGINWATESDQLLWSGVGFTSNNDRVISLDLSNANLRGDLPEDILDIAGLTTINLAGNRITSIPDFSSLANLTSVDVSGNSLEFDDLAPNMDLSGTIVYAAQRLVGISTEDT